MTLAVNGECMAMCDLAAWKLCQVFSKKIFNPICNSCAKLDSNKIFRLSNEHSFINSLI